jgi:hypothetical protein
MDVTDCRSQSSRFCSVRWLVFLAFVLFAAACNDKNSIFYGNGPLKPDDPDYPALNPNPAHKLRLTVSGIALAKARFFAHYTTDPTGGPEPKCGQQVGLAGYFALGKIDPIEMDAAEQPPGQQVGSGIDSTGWVVIDKYLPGKCHWSLQLVGYEIGHRRSDQADNQLIVYSEQIDNRSPVTFHWDLWCYKAVKELKTDNPICEPLWMLLTPDGYSRHATRDFGSHFTQSQQGVYAQGPFDFATQELRVEFHDIDAIPGALVPLRYCKNRVSTLPCNEGDTNFDWDYEAHR